MNETKKIVYVGGDVNHQSTLNNNNNDNHVVQEGNGYKHDRSFENSNGYPSNVKFGGDTKNSEKKNESEYHSEDEDSESESEDTNFNENDKKSSLSAEDDELSDSESVKTDDLLRLDPLYFRLTKFLQCSQGNESSSEKPQNITDVLFDIRNELRGLNMNFSRYLEKNN